MNNLAVAEWRHYIIYLEYGIYNSLLISIVIHYYSASAAMDFFLIFYAYGSRTGSMSLRMV